ncbi:HDIG domain-containing protein [Candidatus Pacearchaeota archaeon]|nr:HDIG domain-containing protein [Candidatus Pacearchaeota archaeon]
MAEETVSQPIEKEEMDLSFLLDSAYPLLKEFRNKCPGTFKHSQAVTGMVEAVCTELGLDTTFMKVAAMYHDIGKMVNPKHFTENQIEDENPHEKLDPRISFQIISRHPADACLILLNNGNFPVDLIKISVQHHGTSVLKYFYEKFRVMTENDVPDDYFRYQGQKPTCVESMVLMLCDTIQARSRAEEQAGKLDPSKIFNQTYNALSADRQLDDVYMKLGDLEVIKRVIGKELEGMFQKRVDYEKAAEEGDGLKNGEDS